MDSPTPHHTGTAPPGPAAHWSLPHRALFRFLFIFFAVSMFEPFGLLGQMTGLALFKGAWEWLIKGVGAAVFHVQIKVLPNGSGDTTFNYVELSVWVALALAGSLIWSVLNRGSKSHPILAEWLERAARGYLALAMVTYGMNKLVPVQFGVTQPADMLDTMATVSPMGLLWRFMASSPAYTMFTGFAEVLSGWLLLFRRTKLLGAMLCAAVMAHVVMLNLCYDVPVKLFSMRLLLIALLLVAPAIPRLLDFFWFHRPTVPALAPPLVADRGANLALAGCKVMVFAAISLLIPLNSATFWWPHYFGKETVAFAGIWQVQEFTSNGNAVPPLLSDRHRWQRLVIQGGRQGGALAVIQHMNGSTEWMRCDFDAPSAELKLTPFSETKDLPPKAKFRVTEPNSGELHLSGKLAGADTAIKLKLQPDSKYPLLSRGFHWINEYPFSR